MAGQFNTFLVAKMNEDGFVDFNLPENVTTSQPGERFCVAVRAKCIPPVVRAPMTEADHYKLYISCRYMGKPNRDEDGILDDEDAPTPVGSPVRGSYTLPDASVYSKEKNLATYNTGWKNMPTNQAFNLRTEILEYIFRNAGTFSLAQCTVPLSLREQVAAEKFPDTNIMPSDYITLGGNEHYFQIRTDTMGMAEALGGPFARCLKIDCILFLSKSLARHFYGREIFPLFMPPTMANFTPTLRTSGDVHLMMDAIELSQLNDTLRPVLLHYSEGEKSIKILDFHRLKDRHNTGPKSVFRTLRMWLEDDSGRRLKVERQFDQDPNLSVDLVWRRMSSTRKRLPAPAPRTDWTL